MRRRDANVKIGPLVGDLYPTTLSKDNLSRICPRNNRPDSRAPLQSLVGRPSSILRSPRTVGKGARLASDFTAKARLGNVSPRAEKGGIICKKAAIMGGQQGAYPGALIGGGTASAQRGRG